MTDSDVLRQMAAVGLAPPGDLKADGKVQRFRVGGKRTGPANGWYVLHLSRLADGTEVFSGAFGDWKTGEQHKVSWQLPPMSDAARAAWRAQQAAQRAAQDVRRRQEADMAAMRANELWARAKRVGTSPYLQRKGLQGEGCRYLPDGTLVLPLLRLDAPSGSRLRAVQRVLPDGSKRFSRGMEKSGLCIPLGWVGMDACRPVLICEGYATALTLRMALGHQLPVLAALDAGNLVHVAELVRRLHRFVPLLICADDDHGTHLRTSLPGQAAVNPGMRAADLAARNVRHCQLAYPSFAPTLARGPKHTDYDDLRQLAGIAEVQEQLAISLRRIGFSKVLNAA